MRLILVLLGLFFLVDVCGQAAPRRRYVTARYYSAPSQPATTQQQTEPPEVASEPATVKTATDKSPTDGSDDALSEVNAARARRGLKPFLPDPLLNQAARRCAQQRAAHSIEGHLESDFEYLPAGASASAAGCGALPPSWGWGTCCTYDDYTYAGAAWRMGADGQRYMHLFVR